MYLTKFATKLYAKMWDLFVERRYFKFQNEIQFSSNSIMEQLKLRDSDSFCDRNLWVASTKSCIVLLAWQVFANVTG